MTSHPLQLPNPPALAPVTTLEEHAVTCPRCGSQHFKKAGRNHHKQQQYLCRNPACGRYFQQVYKVRVPEDPELRCPHCGSYHYIKGGKDDSGKQVYVCKDAACGRWFRKEYARLARELSEDIWAVAALGIEILPHERVVTISFESIPQSWFKAALKQYIRYLATTRTWGTLRSTLYDLSGFAGFLNHRFPYLTGFEQLERDIILTYIADLQQHQFAASTRIHRLCTLAGFFRTGMINRWFTVADYLIRPEDYPRKDKPLPRYIPEEVLVQLNQHLDKLPEPVMRGVVVLQCLGLRIGELLNLKLDCLQQNSKGEWSLRLMTEKIRQEDLLPLVDLAVVEIIQAQQAYIRHHFDQQFEYLFCARARGTSGTKFMPTPQVMLIGSFTHYLKGLAEDYQIRDRSGATWNFQTHQFRHTVATQWINLGIPQHIVQRLLRHKSPEMTAVYAHIHDDTLRKSFDFVLEKMVNVAGEVVQSTNPHLDTDECLGWLRKNMHAQALPNGYCARPLVKGTCPHANACLTCGDFRTTQKFLDVHRTELERTEEILQKATDNGWQRQVEMNQQVAINLRQIITSLETDL